MCGFAGFLGRSDDGAGALHAMGGAIVHRGPDDAGVWQDAEAGIGLSFRRLSIIDLSEAGHQPMTSASGRYVLVFNGEIYNHAALRERLESTRAGVPWRGHSDTETLLAGFDAWGVRRTIEQTVGMFAIAVWDRETRALTLGRDRLGEKPLYYGWQNGVLLFGSELVSLRRHPAFAGEIDRDSIALLLRHNYIPTPYSIYRGIRKLVPGTLLTLSLGDRDRAPQPYWQLADVVRDGLARPFTGSPDEAVDALEATVRESLRGQMVADVPLGAFLSGGIDSSTVVALMQQLSDRPVRTFTIGVEEHGYNEAVYAKDVARHLGTDHTELYVSPREAREVIPLLPRIYSEPFSDSSQIPTFLVSRLARQQVTVSLSGDAGDELFAGYNRYVFSRRLWQRINALPRPLRAAAATMILQLPPRAWNRILNPLMRVLPSGASHAYPGDKLVKGAQVLSARDTAELYRLLVSHWTQPEKVVLGATEPPTVLTGLGPVPETDHFVHEMMALDLLSYLPDDILVKVDRAAMATSLETRVPFLDHRVVEFAWTLPLDYKLRGGVSKWPLRQLLHRYVPREMVERPKMGFGIPIDAWLRGPLREWGEELLDEGRLRREGFLDPRPVRDKWEEHLSGRRNWQYHLWDVLMFQAWLEEESRST